MSKLDDAFKIINKLNSDEKTSLIQLILSGLETSSLLHLILQGVKTPLFGIEIDPAVCGGDPCITRTRIPVWLLVSFRKKGMAESDLLNNYPTLNASDLVNAWMYYQSHKLEIDDQIQ